MSLPIQASRQNKLEADSACMYVSIIIIIIIISLLLVNGISSLELRNLILNLDLILR